MIMGDRGSKARHFYALKLTTNSLFQKMNFPESPPDNLNEAEEGQLSENSEGEGEDLTKKTDDSSDESEEDGELTEADLKFIADDEEEDEEGKEERRRLRKEAKLERRRKRLG